MLLNNNSLRVGYSAPCSSALPSMATFSRGFTLPQLTDAQSQPTKTALSQWEASLHVGIAM